MLCYVCRQRWAPIVEGQSDEERLKVFESNEIRCCGDQDCLDEVDMMILEESDTDFTDRWIKETKEMVERGEI
jgi:5S rRNA maturation endonuclease (ribonuclease M5)